MCRISEIETEKTDLLTKVDELMKLHRLKYPPCDCSLPFREGEKESNDEINGLFSKINALVSEKRKITKN